MLDNESHYEDILSVPLAGCTNIDARQPGSYARADTHLPIAPRSGARGRHGRSRSAQPTAERHVSSSVTRSPHSRDERLGQPRGRHVRSRSAQPTAERHVLSSVTRSSRSRDRRLGHVIRHSAGSHRAYTSAPFTRSPHSRDRQLEHVVRHAAGTHRACVLGPPGSQTQPPHAEFDDGKSRSRVCSDSDCSDVSTTRATDSTTDVCTPSEIHTGAAPEIDTSSTHESDIVTPAQSKPTDTTLQVVPREPRDIQRREFPVSPRMLDLIRQFDVDECAKYPLGFPDQRACSTRTTQTEETRSDDTESDPVGTDTAIEDIPTVSTDDRHETGSGATRGLRSHPATEIRHGSDGPMQVISPTPWMMFPSTRATSTPAMYPGIRGTRRLACSCAHVTHLYHECARPCRAEAVPHDVSRPGAPRQDADRDQDRSDASRVVSPRPTAGIDVTDSFNHDGSALTPTQPVPSLLLTTLGHEIMYTVLLFQEDPVREFEQEDYGTMMLRELCGCEIAEFSARTLRRESTGTTARTTWTCANAQYAAVVAICRGWISPCVVALAKLDDLLQAQAPRADMNSEQMSIRASADPRLRARFMPRSFAVTVGDIADQAMTRAGHLCRCEYSDAYAQGDVVLMFSRHQDSPAMLYPSSRDTRIRPSAADHRQLEHAYLYTIYARLPDPLYALWLSGPTSPLVLRDRDLHSLTGG